MFVLCFSSNVWVDESHSHTWWYKPACITLDSVTSRNRSYLSFSHKKISTLFSQRVPTDKIKYSWCKSKMLSHFSNLFNFFFSGRNSDGRFFISCFTSILQLHLFFLQSQLNFVREKYSFVLKEKMLPISTIKNNRSSYYFILSVTRHDKTKQVFFFVFGF